MKNELVIENKPKSNISEEIRTIKTNIQFTTTDEDIKTLLITSSIPGEGKSFISSNLACAFAKNAERVLLIDCDLRLGRVHKMFGASNEQGLSNLLVSKDFNCKDYLQKTKIENLYILPRGTVVPNPSELLNSEKMKNLIVLLKQIFDRIIFDGVPINGLPDSLIMANLADRVVLVTSCNYTKIEELTKAKKALETVGTNIAGIVVNRAPKPKKNKYNNYYE